MNQDSRQNALQPSVRKLLCTFPSIFFLPSTFNLKELMNSRNKSLYTTNIRQHTDQSLLRVSQRVKVGIFQNMIE